MLLSEKVLFNLQIFKCCRHTDRVFTARRIEFEDISRRSDYKRRYVYFSLSLFSTDLSVSISISSFLLVYVITFAPSLYYVSNVICVIRYK